MWCRVSKLFFTCLGNLSGKTTTITEEIDTKHFLSGRSMYSIDSTTGVDHSKRANIWQIIREINIVTCSKLNKHIVNKLWSKM